MQNQNQTQNKSTGKSVIIALLLIVTIVALVFGTYAWAKYTSTFDGEATAVVAKWNVEGESTDLTWTKTFDHVVAERLAPGTSGTIPVSFDINDTEVDVQYTITLDSAENKPTYLKFYTDSTKTQEITVGGTAYTGVIKVGGEALSEGIYWEWPYENGDDKTDTEEGEAAKTMTVKLTIDAVQVQPE